MPSFDRYYFTASGRLGLWDTFDKKRDAVTRHLKQLLRRHGGVSVEATGDSLYETGDPDVTALGAILDKLVSRGHPTIVDLDFKCVVVTEWIVVGGVTDSRQMNH